MGVQPDGQRDLRAHGATDDPNEVGFAAPDVFHKHGSVQDQADPVQLPRTPDAIHDLISQLKVGAFFDDTGWTPAGGNEDRDGLEV